MSFSRAFSARRKEPELEISLPMHIGRAASQRGGKPVLRAQISAPTALVSTSNQQIHRAQTIFGTEPIEIRHVSSESTSSASSDESDTSIGSAISHDTVTDASSLDESPIATDPEPNYSSTFFIPDGVEKTMHSRTASQKSPTSSSRPSIETPRIHQRAPSHVKRSYDGIHIRQASAVQAVLSPPPVRHSNETHNVIAARSSTDMFSPTSPNSRGNRSGGVFVEAPKENPFGRELAQLDQVAEEFGQVVCSAEKDADTLHMEKHGLACWTAGEYMIEIQELFREMFREDGKHVRFDFGGFF